MATPIKTIPILTGQQAIDFEKEAELNANKPHPYLSEEEKEEIKVLMERSKEYKFPWD